MKETGEAPRKHSVQYLDVNEEEATQPCCFVGGFGFTATKSPVPVKNVRLHIPQFSMYSSA